MPTCRCADAARSLLPRERRSQRHRASCRGTCCHSTALAAYPATIAFWRFRTMVRFTGRDGVTLIEGGRVRPRARARERGPHRRGRGCCARSSPPRTGRRPPAHTRPCLGSRHKRAHRLPLSPLVPSPLHYRTGEGAIPASSVLPYLLYAIIALKIRRPMDYLSGRTSDDAAREGEKTGCDIAKGTCIQAGIE